MTLLAYEATRGIAVEPLEVPTPVGPARGVRLARPVPLVVPVLRAGLGMLDGMTRLLPTAEVGFLGMVRDETSLTATAYADRLPEDLAGREVYVLDPMLATGGTLVMTIELMRARGAGRITAVCLLAAPEGIARLEQAFPDDDAVVTAAVDERLDERGYITPGLGDAGDRLYGVGVIPARAVVLAAPLRRCLDRPRHPALRRGQRPRRRRARRLRARGQRQRAALRPVGRAGRVLRGTPRRRGTATGRTWPPRPTPAACRACGSPTPATTRERREQVQVHRVASRARRGAGHDVPVHLRGRRRTTPRRCWCCPAAGGWPW